MQSSSSFSDSRSGKARPSNLLSLRAPPSESLPWPSPSFDVLNNANSIVTTPVSADPGRPSTQAKSSPTSSLPPTPLTATYKPLPEPAHGGNDKDHLRLPGVRDMLAHTPPESHSFRPVALPAEEAAYRTPGPSHRATMADRSGPSSPRSDLLRVVQRNDNKMQVSSSTFRNMPQSDEVQGLGLELNMGGEDTPRLGDMDWTSMATPTNVQHARMPGAPHLSSAQSGRLSSGITSPIQPPLRNWNTDLRFDERAPYVPYSRPPMQQRSFSDAPASVAMERERAMDIEARMPQSNKVWGLAMSMDNGESYRRGDFLYRPDGSVIGSASMVRSTTGPQPERVPFHGPPTPARASQAGEPMSRQSSASKSYGGAPSSTGKSPHLSTTGLTPHIHKTRLTPTFSARSKGSNGKGSPTTGTESPSLKMKSKQRSEQLRSQAANVAAQANLPSEHASVMGQTASGQVSPTRMAASMSTLADEAVHSPVGSSAPAMPVSVSPRKRSMREQGSVGDARPTDDAEANAQQASSPWGVFELGSTNKQWQPLGPPALSNVLGKLNLDGSAGAQAEDEEEYDDDDDDDAMVKARSTKAKRARKTPLASNAASRNASPAIMSSVARRSTSPSSYIKRRGTPNSGGSDSGGNDEKENDVFGSSTIMSDSIRTASSNTSPSKQAQRQGSRRLLSIR